MNLIDSNITFAFQLPLPREGIQLDYSRWMQNLLTILIPDVIYDERIEDKRFGGRGDQRINATVKMKIRLGVRNIGDQYWKEYATKDGLKRTITCKIEDPKVFIIYLFKLLLKTYELLILKFDK